MRVIFLDIDGPMIPGRQYGTKTGTHRRSKSGKSVGYRFDAFSVHLVSHLAKTADARIVWNTMHNERGLAALTADAKASGLSVDLFHPQTPQTTYPAPLKLSGRAWTLTRLKAIRKWLKEHPDTTHWVALDDELIKHPNAILIDFESGITSVHVDRAMAILGVEAPKMVVV